MGKDSEMYYNDSKGYESEAKEAYAKILDLFATTDGWSQEKLANYLKINSTTLRKYRREGSVSLYTTKRLSNLLGIDRGYFNGRLTITDEIEMKIREKLSMLKYEEAKSSNVAGYNDDIEKSKEFINILRIKVANANSYDYYSLEELDELKQLIENNLLMVTGRAQIIRVVKNNIREKQ